MKPFLFVNLISFYEYVRCGLWASSGPFPSRPIMGSIRGEGTPPPPRPTNPSRHLKKERSVVPLKWLRKEGRGRSPTAAACLRATAAAAATTAATPCPGHGSSLLSSRRRRSQAATASGRRRLRTTASPSSPPSPSLVILLPQAPPISTSISGHLPQLAQPSPPARLPLPPNHRPPIPISDLPPPPSPVELP